MIQLATAIAAPTEIPMTALAMVGAAATLLAMPEEVIAAGQASRIGMLAIGRDTGAGAIGVSPTTIRLTPSAMVAISPI